jgi:lysozyme family protein
MQHPFDVLAREYSALWSTMEITRLAEANAAARRLLGAVCQTNYESVHARTGVPIVWLAAVHERESGADFSTYLGNGQALSKVTTEVPAGRGPFLRWDLGAVDALHLDRVDQVSVWVLERALYEGEAWNGFGPRGHNVNTGYLWAGTNHYTKGKYVSDGKWDPDFVDPQVGIAPIMKLMMDRISLDLPMATRPVGTPVNPTPAPIGVGGAAPHGMIWVQHALNLLRVPEEPLVEDGNYGRLSRRALVSFQESHGLAGDGLAGPKTMAALEAAMAANPPCPPSFFASH